MLDGGVVVVVVVVVDGHAGEQGDHGRPIDGWTERLVDRQPSAWL